PLLAINSADDLINPPDLGILERQIKRVKNGKAITIPESSETRGHGTHTRAVVWKNYLEEFLKQTEGKKADYSFVFFGNVISIRPAVNGFENNSVPKPG